MASSCLTCISAILDDMQLLEDLCPKTPLWEDELIYLRTSKMFLGILSTFLLCVRKWGDDDDANLGGLAVRMKDYISKLGQAIHKFYLTSVEDGYSMDLETCIPDDLVEEGASLKQEIKDLYSSSRLSSKSLVKKDDLMDVMDSLLESLRYVCLIDVLEDDEDQELWEDLQEKLTFLKNFICFVTLHGIDDGQLGPLLTHTKSVAVNTASNYLLWGFRSFWLEKYLVRDLLPKIIPVEPEVHRTCFQALIASKISRQPYEKKDEHIFRVFIDTLLIYLWEILKTGACVMISLKDRLKMVYDGLRSLRIILKGNPDVFDEKMRDLTGLLLCDAGVVIFSLSLNEIKDGSVKEIDLESFHDFLKRIKLIKAIVAEKYPETSSKFPRTNELGFIDFLLKYIGDLTNPDAHSVALSNYPIHAIHEELVYLRSFLGRIVELRNEDQELQALWDRVVEVAYKVEFLIDSLLVGDILDSSSISFDSVEEEIKNIKAAALNIFDKKTLDLNVKEATKRPNNMPSRGSMPIINDMIVGLEDEATSIINRLTRGSSLLQIVPIVGMPGLGKTTLAKKVYNNPLVTSHFYTCAWCTVSQVYHRKNLLLEILTCIHSKLPEKISEMCEEDLAAEVRRGLLRTRYLIVLDDIWDAEAWKGLEASFPDNQNSSRVILTSRKYDVAASRDEGPHFLRPLTPKESWDLLNMKLFPGKDLPPPELCKLQMKIVEMCQGLPLTIVILAGILANEDQHGWKELVDGLSSRIVSNTEQCSAAIELSYKNLPDNLKQCFLYFGAFPEDHEHTAEKLIWLWGAEGFTQKTQFKSAEDVANDFLMDLIHRSLVIVSKQRSIGGVKACRVHDLLHEFCVTKGKEENFMRLVRGYDEIYTLRVPRNLRRLCINSKPEHLCKSRLFAPTIHSLIHSDGGKRYPNHAFEISSIFGIFKLVRVVGLSNINLGTAFPRELELLVQLRYLAILGNMESIPSSIANLSNLETFILKTFVRTVLLPDTVWNLKKLRHLQIKEAYFASDCSFLLPTDNLDAAANLCDLNTFSRLSFSSLDIVRKVFSKIPIIHKLKCILVGGKEHNWVSADRILVLDFPSGLESLNLMCNHYACLQNPSQFEFQFPLAIRKLTLSCFRFPWGKISTIENLPNLEVLKLLYDAFDGEIWNMEKEGFPKVRFLEIFALNIVKWTAYEGVDCFPSLQKLVLKSCRSLKEIPSCLGRTLDIIEASNCPYSASFIKPLREEQMDFGNTDLKILIS